MPVKGVRIGREEINYITLFEGVTGATANDCIVDRKGGRVILVVKEGQMGLAIGQKGVNLRRLEEMTGKRYEIIEYSDNPANFVRHVMRSIQPREIRILEIPQGGKTLTVVIDRKHGRKWMRGGYYWRLSLLVKRYFDVDKVRVLLR